MTTQAGSDGRREPHDQSDAGHLDEDPEALEDPVHAGDARHQHELHEHEQHEHEQHEPAGDEAAPDGA